VTCFKIGNFKVYSRPSKIGYERVRSPSQALASKTFRAAQKRS